MLEKTRKGLNSNYTRTKIDRFTRISGFKKKEISEKMKVSYSLFYKVYQGHVPATKSFKESLNRVIKKEIEKAKKNILQQLKFLENFK